MTDTTNRPAAVSRGENPPVRRLDDWNRARLETWATEYGTPLYVLDCDRVRENYDRLADAFPDAEISYAAKANALGVVLETLLEAGASIECASAGEVSRALAVGAPGERLFYTAVNPPAADLDAVVEWAREEPELTITVGAADTIDRLADRRYDGRLCLRVNPGIGAGHHEKVRTGSDAKFGVPADRAAETLADATDRGFDVVGIHAHVGSGFDDDELSAHRAFVSELASVASAVESAVGPLEFVDVGGGFGVPYGDEDPPLALAALATATREELDGLDARTVIEPGRYLVADAGVLLARVNTVKETPETTVVGIDAGMTTLVRPAMYGAYHPIRPLADGGSDRERTAQTVVGPICESSDVFCTDRDLPRLDRGEYVAIGFAGAYGYEMASTYNSRPRPASVVVESGRPRRARRRETLGDLRRLEMVNGASADGVDNPDGGGLP